MSDPSPVPAPPAASAPTSDPADSPARAMRWALVAAVGNMVSLQFFTGRFLVLYALALEMDPRTLGLMQLVLKGAALIRLPMARWVGVVGKRKILLRDWGAAVPLCLPVVFAPQFGKWLSVPAVWVLLVGTLFYNLFTQGGAAAWLPLLQDIVPAERRGRFFALMRTIWQTVVGIVFAASAVWLGSRPEVADYQVVFGLAWTFVLVRFVGVLPMPAGHSTIKEEPEPFFKFLARPFREPRFRIYLVLTVVHAVAWGAIEPFQLVWLNALGKPAEFSTYGITAASVGAILSLYFWGQMTDRFGSRPVYALSSLGAAATSAAFCTAPLLDGTPGLVWVVVLFLLSGCFIGGFGIALTHNQMAIIPKQGQAIYFSTHMFVLLVANGSGAFIGGYVVDGLAESAPTWFGAGWDVYQWMFAVCSILLLVPIPLCRYVSGADDTGLRSLVLAAWRRARGNGG